MASMPIVVVTGASSGIGREACLRFASMNFHVVGCARREDRLHQLKEEIGGVFTPVQTDLRDPKDIDRLFETVSKIDGPFELLINNAGIGYETSMINGDPEHWKEMIEINLLAVAHCTRKALDVMIPKNKGHIVTVSSMSAHRVTDGGGVYSASKYGVSALIEGLRQELSSRKSTIRTTLVSPGFVETEFYDYYYHTQNEEQIGEMFQSMKALRVKDVVDAIVYSFEADDHVGINDILMRPLEQLS